MPAVLLVPSSKCAGPDDGDCFVIFSSSRRSPEKAKMVHPRILGRRFGAGPFSDASGIAWKLRLAQPHVTTSTRCRPPVCTESLIRVDEVTESPILVE
jgi:hypothetical protein